MDADYIPIDGLTVINDALKSFDVYCHLDGKTVMYMPADTEISEKIRDRIADIDTRTLYIHKKDISYYHSFLEEILGSILNDPGVEDEMKARVAFDTLGALGKQLFTIPDQKILKRYKFVAIVVTGYIMNNEKAFHFLNRHTDNSASLASHSINVGIISMALAKKILGNNPKYNFDEIGAGFFLHDIGKTTIPVEVLNKKGPLSPVEWTLVKRHPTEGIRILNHFEMLSNEAKVIVSQHHERTNGMGYPKGLMGDKIHVLGKICFIADCFDSLTSMRPYRDKYSTFNALKIMKQEMSGDFDLGLFQKFVLLLSR